MLAKTTAEPAPTPVTTPAEVTVATPGVLLDHATFRPGNGWPVALSACAVNATVLPMVITGEAGVTTTLPTGMGVTVTCAVPLRAPLVAVIVARPGGYTAHQSGR